MIRLRVLIGSEWFTLAFESETSVSIFTDQAARGVNTFTAVTDIYGHQWVVRPSAVIAVRRLP